MARYRWAARTDVGMKREHNEDSFLVNEDLGLYVVCDGMGGHAGGETASRLAVQTIERELLSAKLRVGDSRAYLVREGDVHQLSEDHSLVNEQVRAGLLTEEEARHSRLKNIITRSVGFEEDVLVDVMGVETLLGDKFLLCSDGLSNLMENEEIRDALLQNDLDAVPEKLIQLANERGGDDNITVVAVQRIE